MRLSRLFTPTRLVIVATTVVAALTGAVLTAPGDLAAADTAQGAQFVASTGRIFDTRDGTGGFKTAMPANTWRTVQVTGKAGVPSSSSVTAVALNLIEVSPSGLGQVSVRPNPNTAATLVGTFDGGDLGTTSNQADVAVNRDGTIQVETNASTQLVADVEGYYSTDSSAAGGYAPIAGKRYAGDQAITANGNYAVQITGVNGIPSNATAVVADFVVKNKGTDPGHIAPGPAGSSVPTTSLSYPGVANVATATSAHVQLSGDGKLEVWNRNSTVIALSIDIEGYFIPGSSTAGSFTPSSGRAYDTRVKPHVSVPKGKTITIPLGGTHHIPRAADGLSSVVVDLIAIHASTDTAGFARAWADGTAEPNISDVEYAPNSIRSNTNTVPVGLDGAIEIHNLGTAAVDFVVDIEGWYAGPSSTLCAHDDTTILNASTVGADQGDPTLSAALTNGLGEPVNATLFIQDQAGNEVGTSPEASGQIESGSSAIYHPAGLAEGATYTWWLHATVTDACASQATSPRQVFTMGRQSLSQPTVSTITLPGADLGTIAGPVGGAFSAGPISSGTDGSSAWSSEMKVNFSKLPDGSRITKAVLHGGSVTCLSAESCADETATLIPVNTDVASIASPDEAAAVPATEDSIILSGAGGDVDITALAQSWYGGGEATDTGAVIHSATSATKGFRLSSNSTLEVQYVAPTRPTAPTQIKVTPGDGGLLIGWAAPADPGYLDRTGATDGISGYTVALTQKGTSNPIINRTVTGDSTVVTGLSDDTTYVIQVSAKNAVGTGPVSATEGTPSPVASGPSGYIDEVQKLATAQTEIASGASASTADAAGTDPTVRDGLGVNGSELVQQSDAAATTDQTDSEDGPKLSDVLVAPNSGSNTVTVFATIADSGITVDSSDPAAPVTLSTGSTESVAYTLTTESLPAFVSTADTAAVALPVPPTAGDTLTDPSADVDGVGQAPLELDSGTGEISATDSSTSSSTAKTATAMASSSYVSVNYSGIARWAKTYAASDEYNGYRDDCTDFAARAMYYGGGMRMIRPPGLFPPRKDTNDHHWYHDGVVPPHYSLSWGVALDSLKFVEYEGTAVSHSRDGMGVGDVVYSNWSGDRSGKHVNHAGIIVKVTSKNVYIAQHSPSRVDSLEKQKGYHSWRQYGPHMYLWITRPVESK